MRRRHAALVVLALTAVGTVALTVDAVADPSLVAGPAATATPAATDTPTADGGPNATAADRMLVVAEAETGERYLTTPVENGTVVALEYTHSVEKSRVYEAYAVRGTRLEETRMEFESYGWGLPSGANVTLVNGTFVYDPPGSLRTLTVAPGPIADHRLHVGNRTYDLVELSGGESVDLYVDRSPALARVPCSCGATPVNGSNSATADRSPSDE